MKIAFVALVLALAAVHTHGAHYSVAVYEAIDGEANTRCEVDDPGYGFNMYHVDQTGSACKQSNDGTYYSLSVAIDTKGNARIGNFKFFCTDPQCQSCGVEEKKSFDYGRCIVGQRRTVLDDKGDKVSIIVNPIPQSCLGGGKKYKDSKTVALASFMQKSQCNVTKSTVTSVEVLGKADGKCRRTPGATDPKIYRKIVDNEDNSVSVWLGCDDKKCTTGCDEQFTLVINECDKDRNLLTLDLLDECATSFQAGGHSHDGGVIAGVIIVLIIVVVALLIFYQKACKTRAEYTTIQDQSSI